MKNKMHQRVRHRGRLEHIVRGLFTSGVKILNKLFPRPNPRIKDTFEGKWTLNITNTLRLPLSRIPGVEMCVFKARPGVADGELGPKMALRPNFQWGFSHFGHSLSPEVRGGEKKNKQTRQSIPNQSNLRHLLRRYSEWWLLTSLFLAFPSAVRYEAFMSRL